MLSGPVTAIPLLLFAAGARRLPLATLGILQYISPTLQLLTGVLLLGETFSGTQAVGFSAIWAGLVVYAADGLWRARRQPANAPVEHCAEDVPACDGAAPPPERDGSR